MSVMQKIIRTFPDKLYSYGCISSLYTIKIYISRETENEDLTSVMQKIVCTYTEQLVPVAVDICQHLVGTFAQVVNIHFNTKQFCLPLVFQ